MEGRALRELIFSGSLKKSSFFKKKFALHLTKVSLHFVCVCVFIKLHITAQSGPVIYSFHATVCNPPGGCVCVCVFSSHSFWTSSSLDVPAGVTQEEGNTEFFIHLLSAVRALNFLSRRIQPFLSLVDREVEFGVLTI